MPNVELGFLEPSESWKLESRLFPSKVGGKPAWLSLKPLPTTEEFTCESCGKTLIFLCQIYAPFEKEKVDEEILANNFHRTVFVFICRNGECFKQSRENIKVLRSSLPRTNAFYSPDPPDNKPDPSFQIYKFTNLCSGCGIEGDKKCGKCKSTYYCCKQHQILDWKYHKKVCAKSQQTTGTETEKEESAILFPEFELITEMEEIHEEGVDENEAIEEFERLQAEGQTGTLNNVPEQEFDSLATSDKDKTFSKFRKIIYEYPDQVIRYSRGGNPLLIAKQPLPENIPNCEYCGAKRQFEFQIMPQMLFELKERFLDWGVLLIYTCKNSCVGEDINSYKKEVVFRQDVSSEDSL